MKTKNPTFDIVKSNGKFVVTKDKEPIRLPKTGGSNIVTEFDTREDAEKYLSILQTLVKQSQYK